MTNKVTHEGGRWSNLDNDIVEIWPPDASWPVRFAEEANAIRSALGERFAYSIHHVGSTAVPGLAAKPIVDIILEVPNRDSWAMLIGPLQQIGYTYWYENPDKNKMFFVKGMPPFGTGRTHHIHVQIPDSVEPVLRFRDYLIGHPEEAKRYDDLKRQLATKFARDREGYTRAKDGFVQEVLRKSAAAAG
jgi:GrpB-like predicted nucleotidyltransferase (UPF0157 family)